MVAEPRVIELTMPVVLTVAVPGYEALLKSRIPGG